MTQTDDVPACSEAGSRLVTRECRFRSSKRGERHPLPCGLDEDCPVPVEYFDAEKDDAEALEAYEEENLY